MSGYKISSQKDLEGYLGNDSVILTDGGRKLLADWERFTMVSKEGCVNFVRDHARIKVKRNDEPKEVPASTAEILGCGIFKLIERDETDGVQQPIATALPAKAPNKFKDFGLLIEVLPKFDKDMTVSEWVTLCDVQFTKYDITDGKQKAYAAVEKFPRAMKSAMLNSAAKDSWDELVKHLRATRNEHEDVENRRLLRNVTEHSVYKQQKDETLTAYANRFEREFTLLANSGSSTLTDNEGKELVFNVLNGLADRTLQVAGRNHYPPIDTFAGAIAFVRRQAVEELYKDKSKTDPPVQHGRLSCHRCGRRGHVVRDCRATHHSVTGTPLPPRNPPQVPPTTPSQGGQGTQGNTPNPKPQAPAQQTSRGGTSFRGRGGYGRGRGGFQGGYSNRPRQMNTNQDGGDQQEEGGIPT